MFGIRSTWIALGLVVAAVAAPTALGESPLAAKTEAAGYAGITRYHVQHASQSDAAVLAARDEAKGLRALARFWEQHGPSSTTVSSPSDGFAWGDASIGAATTVVVFLIGAAAAFAVRRREGFSRLRS